MNDLDRRALIGAAGLAGVAAMSAAGRAGGPLNPPAGALASTGKPLTDLQPRTAVNAANTPGDATSQYIISQSGSYMLTGNITGVPGKNAIRISANDVTLDLCGFVIKGVGGTFDGVNATDGNRNTKVMNGTIVDFSGSGINNVGGVSCRFADLQLITNFVGGLTTGADALIERLTVRAGTVGISAGDRARILACEVRDITSGGAGIAAGYDSCLQGCVSFGCAGPCIDASNGSNLRDCNGTGSTASHGIRVNYASSVIRCVANSNALNGIEASNRSMVTECVALSNTLNGIHANFAPLVERNYCDNNGQCGILCDAGGAGTFRHNTCNENGSNATANGAGIRVSISGWNAIENNVVISNYRGIDVLTNNNGVYGNRARVNTIDYNIVAGNSYGPIVATNGVGDVSGTANANHPLANLRY